MHGLAISFMNSSYEVQIRRDVNQLCKSKSEQWMQRKYDKKVLAYWKLLNENYILTMKKDDGLEDDGCVIESIFPDHLAPFMLSKSKKNMNIIFREINGSYNNIFNYTDTDSLTTEKILDCVK